MRDLEQALDAIHREAGEDLVAPPVDRQTFGMDSVTHEVSWKRKLFGAVTIAVDEFGMGGAQQLDRFTMVVPIFLNDRTPDAVTFSFKMELADGVHLFHAQNGPATDCTDGKVPKFSIPVTWTNSGRRDVPSTVSKIGDDIDLVFLDTKGNGDGRTGAFIQLEISLSTRHGQFFLAVQEVYAGQVVRTTAANAKRAKLDTVPVGSHLGSVVPLFPENAYPGVNFFENFKYLAGQLVTAAIECGASVPLSKCVIARWDPQGKRLPASLKHIGEGWEVATVMWFNAVIGGGFVYVHSLRKVCFVHFKQIQDALGRPIWKGKLTFPMLTPMRAVWVRYEQGDKGLKATAVRSI